MILDRTWNKKERKLTISYIDKLGNRQFYIKQLHHIKSYEYDENGEFETWNHRRCRKVFKDTANYTPNEFDLLEYMYELPQDIQDKFHAQVFPRLYTFDIETAISNEFPYPDKAEQEVTCISLVGPDLSCMVLGLKQLTQEQKDTFKKRYLEWIDNNEFAKHYHETHFKDKEIKVLYQYFEKEEDMLKHWFGIIIPKVGCLAGWNSYDFDHQYLCNRMIRLLGKGLAYSYFKKSSPTGELSSVRYMKMDGTKITLPAPAHSIILDYMEIVKKYDYILRPHESYKLDWFAEHSINSHKIKYDGTLQQLYERDTEWYYYYNAIDSLLVQLIHNKLKSLESPCAVSSLTLVPLLGAFGQVALTTANVFEQFYKDNKKVVYNYDEIERIQIPYEGAFCGCVPGHYTYCVCDDFKSLYPSQIQSCNFSFENIIIKKVPNNIQGLPDIIVPWTEEELDKYKQDPNYFVSIMGNVYKNDKDYAFKKLQANLMKQRDKYKYTGQKIESELLTEIDRLIKEKESV